MKILVDIHSWNSPAGTPSLQSSGTGSEYDPPAGVSGAVSLRRKTMLLNEAAPEAAPHLKDFVTVRPSAIVAVTVNSAPPAGRSECSSVRSMVMAPSKALTLSSSSHAASASASPVSLAIDHPATSEVLSSQPRNTRQMMPRLSP